MISTIVKIKDVCEFVRGLTYSKSDEVKFSKNTVLRATNIDLVSSKLNLSEIRYIDDSVIIPANKKVKVNDILICTASGSKIHLGKIAFIDKQINMAFGGFMGVLRSKPNINPKYLFAFLKSDIFLKHILNISNGTNINNLKFSQIENLDIVLPQLPIQQKIVAKLDKTFAEIDKAIAAAEANAKNVEAMFDSFYSDYFNREDILFKETNLGELCKTTQGIQISKSQQFKEPKKNSIRYLYISDFKHDKNLKYIENLYPEKIVTTKDIVVVNTGATAGKIFKGINGCLSNNLFKVSYNKNLIIEEFFFYFVSSILFKKYQHSIMRGTANPHMGHENFKSTLIKIPNLDQQKIFISKLNSLKNNLDIITNNYQLKIKELNSLKQSILKQAFSGELVKAA